jgi:hypothetical protein
VAKTAYSLYMDTWYVENSIRRLFRSSAYQYHR